MRKLEVARNALLWPFQHRRTALVAASGIAGVLILANGESSVRTYDHPNGTEATAPPFDSSAGIYNKRLLAATGAGASAVRCSADVVSTDPNHYRIDTTLWPPGVKGSWVSFTYESQAGKATGWRPELDGTVYVPSAVSMGDAAQLQIAAYVPVDRRTRAINCDVVHLPTQASTS